MTVCLLFRNIINYSMLNKNSPWRKWIVVSHVIIVPYKTEVLAERMCVKLAQSKSCISRILTSCQLKKKKKRLDKLLINELDSGRFTLVNLAFILPQLPTRQTRRAFTIIKWEKPSYFVISCIETKSLELNREIDGNALREIREERKLG